MPRARPAKRCRPRRWMKTLAPRRLNRSSSGSVSAGADEGGTRLASLGESAGIPSRRASLVCRLSPEAQAAPLGGTTPLARYHHTPETAPFERETRVTATWTDEDGRPAALV